MEKELNELALALKSIGHNDATESLRGLMASKNTIRSICESNIKKEAQDHKHRSKSELDLYQSVVRDRLAREASFEDDIRQITHGTTPDSPSDSSDLTDEINKILGTPKATPKDPIETPPVSNEIREKWQKIIDEYDTPTTNVSLFEKMTSKGKADLNSFTSKAQSFIDSSPPVKESDVAAVKQKLLSGQTKEALTGTADYEINEIIKKANIIKNNLSKNSSKMISSKSNYLEAYETLEKSAAWGKILPAVGIIFSGYMTVHHLHELLENGKKILGDIETFKKYNIPANNLFEVALGPISFHRKINKAIEANIDNPDNLYEILDIIKTTAAFALNLVLFVTNAIALILDIICIIVLIIGALGALPSFGITAGIASAINWVAFIVAVVFLIGELALEYWLSPKYWDWVGKAKIKKIAEKKLSELGKPDDSLINLWDFAPAN